MNIPAAPKHKFLFGEALAGTKMTRPPVWFMRQAGRTDPEYNAYKAQLNLPLEEMFQDPEISAHVTLLPRKLGVDALIYYQDILTILGPMGAEFVFRPGPTLTDPINRPADLKRLQPFSVTDEMSFVGVTMRLIQDELAGSLPLLGFAGAPLTLLAFLIEGQSFAKGMGRFKDCLENHADLAHEALSLITRMTIDYLKYQAKSGAFALQLFESAAHHTSPEEYRRFALPYQQEIFAALKGHAPTICFAHNWTALEDLQAAGADVISLPAAISVAEARRRLGDQVVLQGNIPNRLLKDGPLSAIEHVVTDCIRQGACKRHILNLDHGLLPDTPFEHVQFAAEVATAYRGQH